MKNIKLCWPRKYKTIGKNNKIIIKHSDGTQIVLGKHHKVNGLNIEISGDNNTIYLTDKTSFYGSKIIVVANEAVLNFEESPEIHNLSIFVRIFHFISNPVGFYRYFVERIFQHFSRFPPFRPLFRAASVLSKTCNGPTPSPNCLLSFHSSCLYPRPC